MNFGERVYRLREDSEPRLNQTEFGRRIGLSQRKISHIEKEQTEPSLQDIKAYCEYYNLSADYLIGLTDEPKSLREHADL